MVLTATMGLALILGGAKSPFAQTVSPQNNKQSVETAPSKKPDTQVGESAKSQNPSASQSSTQGLGNPQTPSTQGLGNPQTPSAQGQKNEATQEVKPDAKAQTPSASSASTQEQGSGTTQEAEPNQPELKPYPLPIDFSNIDVGNIPGISVKDLDTLSGQNDSLLEAYGGFTVVQTKDNYGYDHYFETRTIPVPNQAIFLLAYVALGLREGKIPTDLFYVSVRNANGGDGVAFSLSDFAKFYKRVVGEELKYMRIVWDVGHDEKAGDYVTLVFVPIKEPNGRVLPNTPCLLMGYVKDGLHSPILSITK
jgi:hypothetical protein